MPATLSAIVMRLLCKEPEQRYQSGEGLAYDLARLRDAYARGGTAEFALGERDFPMRLQPPARLAGRDGALAALRGLLDEAVAGNCGVAMVTGPPGVGKTALVDRLRPAVAAAGGRFVAGKFDQYRRDLGADAVLQAFSALGAQLLAEPDEEVARLRARLLDALGPNAGLAAAGSPAFAALLGVPPEDDTDPRRATVRIRQLGMDLLHVIASSAHPVVIFIDDLQWAGPAAFGFLDAVLDEPDLPGVLVLGAFREAEVDEAHPLTAVLARLRRTRGAGGELRLANLPPDDLSTLLAGMLRLPESEAAPLAEQLAERTGGNPFDTLELVNALRRDGALVPEGEGWRWDPATLRRFVGRGDVVDLLAARIEALPAPARELVEVMACLGGEMELELLRVAAGEPAAAVDTALLPGVEDGLVVVGGGTAAAASFRHDRVQQAAYGRMTPDARVRLHLALARRLAADPGHALAAAQQYLPALDELSDPDERQAAVPLLRAAATAARQVTNHIAAETFLAAAVRIQDPSDAAHRELQEEWHAALCGLGRFAQADEVYERLAAAGPDPVAHAGAACVQIVSLTNRGAGAGARPARPARRGGARAGRAGSRRRRGPGDAVRVARRRRRRGRPAPARAHRPTAGRRRQLGQPADPAGFHRRPAGHGLAGHAGRRGVGGARRDRRAGRSVQPCRGRHHHGTRGLPGGIRRGAAGARGRRGARVRTGKRAGQVPSLVLHGRLVRTARGRGAPGPHGPRRAAARR
jgi:hypothetical protein